MPSDVEYAERIRKMQREELLKLWGMICARDTPGWDPGKAFEYLVLRAFELEGASVRYPFPVPYPLALGAGELGDSLEQIDGAVYAEGLSAIVESKDHVTEINVEPIAKLRNQLLRRPPGALGLLFSRSGFTAPARTLAHFLVPQAILLWEGQELEFGLEKGVMIEGLVVKYRTAVEEGLPDYNITKRVIANEDSSDL